MLGVCEVKKPKHGCLDQDMLVTQITNYMQELHYTYRTRYVFGITTTYNKWKIFWLSNTNKLAEATTVENAIVEANNQTLNIIDETIVYHSKEYDYNDKNLALTLISCLYKMSLSSYNNPINLRDSDAKFRRVTSNLEKYPPWEHLPKDIPITYRYPRGNTTNFYLIQDYHGGRDGYVWLASTCNKTEINIVVIKFSRLLDDENGVNDEIKKKMKQESLENEAEIWKKIWQITKPRVDIILGQHAIIMPFVFHCQNQGSKIFFTPPYRWTKNTNQVPNIFESDEIEENKQFDITQCQKYINNPLVAAKEALKKMIDAGYKHNDVKWSHVALMPSKSLKGDKWILSPIMIDLTDATNIENESEDEKKIILESSIAKLLHTG